MCSCAACSSRRCASAKLPNPYSNLAAASSAVRLPGCRARTFFVVGQSILRSTGLFQKLCEGKGERKIIGCVAARDDQFGSRTAQVMVRDQVTRQFETNVPPSHRSISLPCAVDRSAVVTDRSLHVVSRGSKAGETKIDEAVAGLRLPQIEEAVVGLLGATSIAQCLREQKLVRAGAWSVGQGSAESVDGLIGMPRSESLLPLSAQRCARSSRWDANDRKRNKVIARSTPVMSVKLRKVKAS